MDDRLYFRVHLRVDKATELGLAAPPSKRQTRRSGKKVLACAAKTNQPATPKKDQRTYQDRKEHHHKNRCTGERNISAYLSSEKISFQSSCLFNTHKKFGKSLS